MFSMSMMNKAEVKGHIKFKSFPRLGREVDVDGNEWDIGAIICGTVCAVPLNQLHPYYSDTSGQSFGFVSQSWPPYTFEVVKDD